LDNPSYQTINSRMRYVMRVLIFWNRILNDYRITGEDSSYIKGKHSRIVGYSPYSSITKIPADWLFNVLYLYLRIWGFEDYYLQKMYRTYRKQIISLFNDTELQSIQKFAGDLQSIEIKTCKKYKNIKPSYSRHTADRM